MGSVIVLGAKGRFGWATTQAIVQAGWAVTAFGRGLDAAAFPQARCIQGDAQDVDAVRAACAGADVIVHAVNPPYPDWPVAMPGLTRSVIAAARASEASVLIPGNVYNYGADMPAVLDENTPWHPTTRKGKLRVEMEQAFRAAGVRTIVLRAGDFIDASQSGNWFDGYITPKSPQGQTMYPGPLNQKHAWAYLPDMARMAVALAEKRQGFADFEEFAFAGFGVTGQMLLDTIAAVLDRPQRHKGLPWRLLRVLGLFNPLMREVHEMRYLWSVPHQLDGTKLQRMVPGFDPTPFAEAIRLCLGGTAAPLPIR